MKKILKVFSVVLAMILLITTLSSCGGDKVKKDDIIGQWHAKDGEMEIDVRADGSYDDGGYGTGTWKYLDDGKTIEFMDFYGSTKTTIIVKDEYGYSIFNRRYYRDEYPAEKLTDSNNSNSDYVNDNSSNEQTTGTQKITIDAFAGISYEITGISPYCKISINNSGCSADAQERVTYTLDKEYYANGETVTIKATIPSNKAKQENNEYVLLNTQSTLLVTGQDEYVSLEQKINLEYIKKEVNDKATSIISSSIGTNKICNVSDQKILDYETRLPDANFYSRNGITKVEAIHQVTYFLCLKEQMKSSMNKYIPYNRCSFVYCFNVYGDVNNTVCQGKLYVTITAENIVASPDGSISWNNEKCDFKIDTNVDGFDNCVANTIMSYSDNYNVLKVTS